MFRAKSYFLVKEQRYRRPVDNLEYPKDSVSNLGYKNDLAGITSDTLPLTNYSSKGYSKGEDRAITP